MLKKRLLFLLCLCSFLVGDPAMAASSGYYDIAWIKITPDGVMVALSGFTLQDADPNVCADPGQAYFYLPDTAKNYEERYAALLTAVAGDREISIAYWSCGTNPGAQPMLALGNINLR